jgi:VWFA-related protein
MKATRLIFGTTILAMTAISALHAQAARPRMVCLFLDLNSMDTAAQSNARDSAIQYVQQLIAPSDIVEVMTYTSQLNVVQDFTSDPGSLVAALRSIVPAAGSSPGAANTDLIHAQFQAIQTAVSSLSRFPERKAMVYFSTPVSQDSASHKEDLKDAINAAVRANVAVYSVDSRGLALPRQ